ncbi:hypothetical protein ACO2Q3_24785 [Caulobacter sp. KR2-114]|uniref:hypothetical protein n=1 Tax=Caulobacter sp. KR2-114 TaxID=3400912 RepID=UPI003C0A1413
MADSAILAPGALAGDMLRAEFWRERFPALTLPEATPSAADPAPGAAGEADERTLAARLAEEGYFQDRNATFARLAPLLGEAVSACAAMDIPPAFIFLFDEAWACFRSLDPMLRRFLGPDYRMLPDFWTWRVDGAAGQAGWGPHRDKGRMSLAPNGAPLSLTVWAPLSAATPLTSCMYVLPANRDPVYNTENEGRWQINAASIRALPGELGDYFCWNQAVLHWGSEASRFAPHPRLSMALEFQRGDIGAFNQPLIPPFAALDLRTRLKLVAKQILQYRHMYPLAARFEALAQQLLAG